MRTTGSSQAPRWRALAAGIASTVAAIVLLPAGTAAAPPGVRPDLRVDTDRDGVVDVRGISDESGEDAWTSERGAILLPNMDDDARRCRVKTPGGAPLPDAKLAACRDGADTVLNGARDAADLARLRTVPIRRVNARMHGKVTVTGPAAKYNRIFINRNRRWVVLRPSDRITAAELRRGVELGIEATDIVRDSRRWDGRVPVQFSVTGTTGAPPADTVMFRVAPVLTHHHLQPVQQVAVTEIKETAFKQFGKTLEREVKAAGIARPMVKFSKYGDRWTQDFFEPAYASMPGPGGRPTVMRLMIRSAQPWRDAGRELYERLRGPDVGIIQVNHKENPDEYSSLNSMGNLETIPPHRHRGKTYPAGRIIMGQRPEQRQQPSAQMLAMLRSQNAQDPLLLDTGWLSVAHVDEFVQFLPAKTPRGWLIAVADPDHGLKLLRDAEQAGHGATKMFHGLEPGTPIDTISQILAIRDFIADNALAAAKIKENLAVLKRETGVTDEEIIRVPALFKNDMAEGPDTLPRLPDQLQAANRDRDLKRAPAERTLSAFVPAAVNGIVLNRGRYLAPDPHGPLIGGRDIFRDATTAAYREAGLTTRFIDDWYTYHVGLGEVHCGTNTLRNAGATRWWTFLPGSGR